MFTKKQKNHYMLDKLSNAIYFIKTVITIYAVWQSKEPEY